jgi:hypothetical protein
MCTVQFAPNARVWLFAVDIRLLQEQLGECIAKLKLRTCGSSHSSGLL